MKLSHTKINTYETCPKKYKLHYIDKLRPYKINSALIFGNAVDEALNKILLLKMQVIDKELTNLLHSDLETSFLKHFKTASLPDYKTGKNKTIDIVFSDRIIYTKKDTTPELLQPEDFAQIIKQAEEKTSLKINTKQDVEDFIEYGIQTGGCKKLCGDELKLFNYITWHCLYRKGIMLVKQYQKEVLPEIQEVHAIQKEVEIVGPNGNSLVGYIDFIATFKDGVKRLVDNKTASKAYSKDSIKDSQQLCIYSEAMGIPDCAYLVLCKNLRKREPRVRIQSIFDRISPEFYEKTFDKITNIEYNILENNFEENRANCFQFGAPCPYYNYCRTGETLGLVQLKKEE